MNVQTIGILGAGKVGVVLAQLALRAGYSVNIAGSANSDKIALSMKVLAPGAKVLTKEAASRDSDVVILALPLGKYQTIPEAQLDGKLVIDAMNYWWEVDGPRDELFPDDVSTSEAIQRFLPRSRVVKALSHMSYHDLFDETRPNGAKGRRAIAIAGDAPADILAASRIVDRLGFDPLPIGPLSIGVKLEPGYPGFGVNLTLSQLKGLFDTARSRTD